MLRVPQWVSAGADQPDRPWQRRPPRPPRSAAETWRRTRCRGALREKQADTDSMGCGLHVVVEQDAEVCVVDKAQNATCSHTRGTLELTQWQARPRYLSLATGT
jgi:hypothetical protein